MNGGRRARCAALAVAAVALAATACSGRSEVASQAWSAPTTTTTVPPATTTTLATLVSADRIPATTRLLVLGGPAGVSATPGGPPVSIEPATTWGSPTTVPVLATNGAWVQVLLPGPPNGSTGWLPVTAGTIQTDPWFLEVDMTTRQITAFDNGAAVATSPAAIGKPSTPTPVPPGGLTFLTGSVRTVGQYRVESPALRPLALQVTGAEAQVDDAAVGGDQVAIHGWEGAQVDPAIWGATSGLAVSHACVRVPLDFAAGPLTAAPNGTLVRFVS